MPKWFAQSLRTGFYLRVLQEGLMTAGDAMTVVQRSEHALSIRRLFDAYMKPNDRDALAVLATALVIPELSPEWRQHIQQRLQRRSFS